MIRANVSRVLNETCCSLLQFCTPKPHFGYSVRGSSLARRVVSLDKEL